MNLELGCLLCALSELRCARWNLEQDSEDAKSLAILYDSLESSGDQLVDVYKMNTEGSITMEDVADCNTETDTVQAVKTACSAVDDIEEMVDAMSDNEEMLSIVNDMTAACNRAKVDLGMANKDEGDDEENEGPDEFSSEDMPQ